MNNIFLFSVPCQRNFGNNKIVLDKSILDNIIETTRVIGSFSDLKSKLEIISANNSLALKVSDVFQSYLLTSKIKTSNLLNLYVKNKEKAFLDLTKRIKANNVEDKNILLVTYFTQYRLFPYFFAKKIFYCDSFTALYDFPRNFSVIDMIEKRIYYSYSDVSSFIEYKVLMN